MLQNGTLPLGLGLTKQLGFRCKKKKNSSLIKLFLHSSMLLTGAVALKCLSLPAETSHGKNLQSTYTSCAAVLVERAF